MKIDAVELTLFAWEDIPPTKYSAGAQNLGGRSNLGLLTIKTDAGIEGHAFLGSATNPAETDAGALIRFLKPVLMGKDPLAREDLHAALRAKQRNTGLRTIGACDTALWDIAAKAASMPLYRYLGAGRSSIGAYASSQILDSRGAYAEEALVAADRVLPIPDGVDTETAAAAMLQGMTAHYLLQDSYPVEEGDTVLVHAAAGGMGLLLTQLATRLGATVIGTVSTVEKEELAREAGAAHVIRYTETEVAPEVRRLTGGEGVAVVYDGVGKDTFDASLASLRLRGSLVLYGAASGAVPPFDPQRLQAAGSVFLTRPTLVHHIVTAQELRRRGADLFGWIQNGLSIRIHDRYPLAEAGRAHTDLASRRTTGKLLLVP